MIESSLGIIGACLPLLRPIFTDTRAKNAISALRRAVISRSSLRTDSANVPSLEYAKLEAGGLRAPVVRRVEDTRVL